MGILWAKLLLLLAYLRGCFMSVALSKGIVVNFLGVMVCSFDLKASAVNIENSRFSDISFGSEKPNVGGVEYRIYEFNCQWYQFVVLAS